MNSNSQSFIAASAANHLSHEVSRLRREKEELKRENSHLKVEIKLLNQKIELKDKAILQYQKDAEQRTEIAHNTIEYLNGIAMRLTEENERRRNQK